MGQLADKAAIRLTTAECGTWMGSRQCLSLSTFPISWTFSGCGAVLATWRGKSIKITISEGTCLIDHPWIAVDRKQGKRRIPKKKDSELPLFPFPQTCDDSMLKIAKQKSEKMSLLQDFHLNLTIFCLSPPWLCFTTPFLRRLTIPIEFSFEEWSCPEDDFSSSIFVEEKKEDGSSICQMKVLLQMVSNRPL